ncbi:unnamed protein product [Spirodela intermedia]|uniref:Protein kinase domain-containing protein n=1 Tax=Spirodela intermedia TaxID=51605 RepID=A0A7I8LFI5_SPIIN|nr:unnamed protein product [Spirodela intermedia]
MRSGTLSLLRCLPSLLITLSSYSLAIAEFTPDYHPLQAFRSAADPSGAALYSWTPRTDPCSGTWAGVACRGGRVTRILLQDRHLQGTVDDTLTFLPYLRLLNLSHNRLTGELPDGFLRLRRLRRIDLSVNNISGHIPSEIARLPRLLTLRLERNLLTGEIPSSLGSFSVIADFNVSGNRLTGEVPRALSSFPVSSFSSNENLCGEPLLRRCTNQTEGRDPLEKIDTDRRKSCWKWKTVATIAAIVVAVVSILLILLAVVCWRKRGKPACITEVDRDDAKASVVGDVVEEKRVVLFEGCRPFTVDDLMRGSAEMLGRGALGTTYRVVMEGDSGRGVAVKRLRKVKKAREDREGTAAMERLLTEIGGLRHPNVTSLRAYYHSDDELLLVYDYLPNGSLHSLLHGNRGPGRIPLYWTARLKLALGAAEGLAFLHRASKLAHQKLTSSNILVDDDGNACVVDFALLHLLAAPPPPPSSTSRKTLTHESDVYDFGILLLEILTGKPAAEGEVDLQKMVREDWSSELFDVELVACKEAEDEMVGLLQVALLCVAPSPAHRPTMSIVFKMMEEIKERGSKRTKGSPFSPSSSINDSYYLGSSTPVVSEDTASG